MTVQKSLLTAEEFFRLYSGKDGKVELVRGIVVTPGIVGGKHGVEMAPVSEEHGEVAANINYAFKDYSRRRGVGRVGVEIGYVLSRSPDTVRAPDVSINLSPRREGKPGGPASFPGRRTLPSRSFCPAPPQSWSKKLANTWPPALKGSG